MHSSHSFTGFFRQEHRQTIGHLNNTNDAWRHRGARISLFFGLCGFSIDHSVAVNLLEPLGIGRHQLGSQTAIHRDAHLHVARIKADIKAPHTVFPAKGAGRDAAFAKRHERINISGLNLVPIGLQNRKRRFCHFIIHRKAYFSKTVTGSSTGPNPRVSIN